MIKLIKHLVRFYCGGLRLRVHQELLIAELKNFTGEKCGWSSAIGNQLLDCQFRAHHVCPHSYDVVRP